MDRQIALWEKKSCELVRVTGDSLGTAEASEFIGERDAPEVASWS